jgi:hypothetical protein
MLRLAAVRRTARFCEPPLNVLVALAVIALAVNRVDAAEPAIRALSVRGLQVGDTTTLTIDGDNLGKEPRLLLPFAAKQERRAGASDKQATFDVTLAAEIVPGYYNLRVAAEGGVSLPVIIGVDRLPQRPFAAEITALPVALHGPSVGVAGVETKFTGKSGQKVLIEVEAQRLGSKLRPVIHLYNSKRLQLAWTWGKPALDGDARLEATLPADGEYTIAVHDAEYAAPGASFFRLKAGQWSFVDGVFPPVIGKGKQAVELIGPASPVRIDADASQAPAILPLPWPKDGSWSGPRPRVMVSDHREVDGQPTAGKPQDLPAGSVGVSGRLLTPFGEDRYRVPVTPGSKVRFEVFAERLGSPLDTSLVVRNEAGMTLAQVEDGPGTLDPVLEYAVPDKVTAVIVGVVDAQGRGGPKGVYRLTVEPQSSSEHKTFRLITPVQRVSLPVGGRDVVPVLVERHGYQGSITLSADGLPRGVKLEGATIPPGAGGTLVTVVRDAAPSEVVLTTWRGRGEDGQEQTVVVKGHPLERLQPWLATELPVAPTTAQAAEFQVDWRGLPADAGLVPAAKLPLPVKLTRPKTPSAVRLTLVTSQLPPLVNNQPDLNRTLRQEKAVEVAANAIDAEVTLLVPAELTAPGYDVTVQADLLGADKRTVLATAFAPVKRLAVRQSLIVTLEGTGRIEAKLDPKTGVTVSVKGKVERREGLAGDVALTLTGLPPGARADAVTVKAGVSEFTFNVVLPPNLPPGEFKGLKLAGTAAPDPKQSNVRVRSREVDVTLVVQTPPK